MILFWEEVLVKIWRNNFMEAKVKVTFQVRRKRARKKTTSQNPKSRIQANIFTFESFYAMNS